MKTNTIFLLSLLFTFSIFGQKKEYFTQLEKNYFDDFIGTYPISESEAKLKKHYEFSYNRAGDLDYILKSDSTTLIRYFYMGNSIDIITLFESELFSRSRSELVSSVVAYDSYGIQSFRFLKIGKEYKERIPLFYIEFPDSYYEANKLNFEKLNGNTYRINRIPLNSEYIQSDYSTMKFLPENKVEYRKFSMEGEVLPASDYDESIYSQISYYNSNFQLLKVIDFDESGEEKYTDYTVTSYDKNGYLSQTNYIERDGDESSLISYRDDYTEYELPSKRVFKNDENGNWLETAYFDRNDKPIIENDCLCARMTRTFIKPEYDLSHTYFRTDGSMGTFDVNTNKSAAKAKDFFQYDSDNELQESYSTDAKNNVLETNGIAFTRVEEMTDGSKISRYYNAKNEFVRDISGAHHRLNKTLQFTNLVTTNFSYEQFKGDVDFIAVYDEFNELLGYERTSSNFDELTTIIRYVFDDKMRIIHENIYDETYQTTTDYSGVHHVRLNYYADFPTGLNDEMKEYEVELVERLSLDGEILTATSRTYTDSLDFLRVQTRYVDFVSDYATTGMSVVEISKTVKNNYLFSYYDVNGDPIVTEGVFKYETDNSQENKRIIAYYDINNFPVKMYLSYHKVITETINGKIDSYYYDEFNKPVMIDGLYHRVSIIYDSQNREIATYYYNSKNKATEIGYSKKGKYFALITTYDDVNKKVEIKTLNKMKKLKNSEYFSESVFAARLTYDIIDVDDENGSYQTQGVYLYFDAKGKPIFLPEGEYEMYEGE